MARSIAILARVFWFVGISAFVVAGQTAYLAVGRMAGHPSANLTAPSSAKATLPTPCRSATQALVLSWSSSSIHEKTSASTRLVKRQFASVGVPGAGLLELWRMTPAGRREVAICECIVSGVRAEPIGGWDLKWVEEATGVADGSLRHAAGCLLAYLYWLDRSEVEQAGRWLDEALRVRMQSKVGLRASLTGYTYEAAYFAGRYRQDGVAARHWLEMFGKKAERSVMYCLARAAVAGVEGDFEECEVWIAQGRERLGQNRQPSGFTQFEEARLEELEVFLTSSRMVPQELDSFLENQGLELPQDQEDPAPEVGSL